MNLLLFTVFLALAGMAHADEPQLDYRPLGVGMGMLATDIALTCPGLDYKQGAELMGWSYMATDLGYRFLPEGMKFMSPIIVSLFDFGWRGGEGLDKDINRRKLGDDLSGVLGRVSVDFKF